MYDLLSNGEDSDDALNSNDHILNSSENKRVRLDLNTVSTIDSANRTFNENESYHSTTHSVNARPKVFTRPLIGEDCVSVTGTDGGRRVYLHIKREESKEVFLLHIIKINCVHVRRFMTTFKLFVIFLLLHSDGQNKVLGRQDSS